MAAALAAAAVLWAPADSAGAASADSGHGVNGSGGAVVLAPLNPRSAVAVFWCAAVATTAAWSISIDECKLYVDGEFVAEAESVSIAGLEAVTIGLAAVDRDASLQVCWSVSADPIIGSRVYDSGCGTGPLQVR